MDNLELHLGQPFVAHPGEPSSICLGGNLKYVIGLFFFGIEDIPTSPPSDRMQKLLFLDWDIFNTIQLIPFSVFNECYSSLFISPHFGDKYCVFSE